MNIYSIKTHYFLGSLFDQPARNIIICLTNLNFLKRKNIRIGKERKNAIHTQFHLTETFLFLLLSVHILWSVKWEIFCFRWGNNQVAFNIPLCSTDKNISTVISRFQAFGVLLLKPLMIIYRISPNTIETCFFI